MRLLTCAGGTGGGIYPALSVLKAVGEKVEILWVGGEGGMENALVKRACIPFEAIPAAGVHGVGMGKLPVNVWHLFRGFLAARRILRRFKPDVLFFTGGYLAVPMALAGWRIPSLLYVPDIEPGLAHKAIAPFANVIALSTGDSRKYFSRKKVVVTGYPTRPELSSQSPTRSREKFGLTGQLPVLLISGGSRGARSINNAVLKQLPSLLELAQVIHITGEIDWSKIEAANINLPKDLSGRYHPFPYLHEEMGMALAAADLVVSRAGASTLGEYPVFGLPAILVPYPHAWRYQKVNADFLQQKGAAVVLEDSRLMEDLLPIVKILLADPEKRRSMRKAMQGFYRPQAAEGIAAQLTALAGER